MEIITKNRGDLIEVQFSDAYSVKDHESVQRLVEALVAIKKELQVVAPSVT